MPSVFPDQEVPDAAVADRVEMMRAMFGAPRPSMAPNTEGPDCDTVICNPKIAIIDDQPINIKVVQRYLKLAGYQRFFTTVEAREAAGLIRQAEPDVVLLDIMMPHVSGLDILADLRRSERFVDLPVIILTAASDKQTKLDALRLGATDFLQKPIDPVELETRLRNVLTMKAHQDRIKSHAWELEREVAIRSAELAEAYREVVQCLARVGEFRDNETGKHTLRVGRYAEIITIHLGMGKEFASRIREAAPLHDIGKVGIPDSILLKPGKLDEAEFEQMRGHSRYGRDMCAGPAPDRGAAAASHTTAGQAITAETRSPILRMAAVIAHTHHERWDGAGYPRGLKGEEIPIEGRITAVADVFDALTSQRPYKPAFSLEKSTGILRAQSGTQFDPSVVDAFFAGFEQIVSVYNEYADPPQAA
ncbi:MAG: HD domain-containing phosphohydrolase [Thermoguttaceae bacterium]